MQQLVRMDLAQAVEQSREDAADEALGDLAAVRLDEFLQRAATFVFHDHVHRVVGAEEIEHANDVGVRKAGQGTPFLEEALHPVAKRPLMLGGDQRPDFPLAAQGEAVWKIFLDRDALVLGVGRQIDDRKPAERELARYRVFLDLEAIGQRVVGLLRH